MSRLQNPELIEAIQAAAQKYGMKELAARLDMAPSTLYQKLNPYGDRGVAKLGAEELQEIMQVTEDYEGLFVLAGNLGFSVTAIACAPASECTAFPSLANAVSTIGELASALQRDMQDSSLTKAEKLELFERAVDAHKALEPFLALGAAPQNRTK